MKKLFLTLLAAGGAVGVASAQVEIGLKVSPSITYLRVDAPDSYNFRNDKSKLSIGGGLVVDYFFGQNYIFSTGLLFTGKGGTITYQDDAASALVSQKVGLQYLEIPLTIKLLTNDIAPDTKMYFQVGGSANMGLATKINGSRFFRDPGNNNAETRAYRHFIFPDVALVGGTGVEYQVGQNTKIMAGISYHRGLVNIDRYFEKTRGFRDIALKNNEFALDLGLKF